MHAELELVGQTDIRAGSKLENQCFTNLAPGIPLCWRHDNGIVLGETIDVRDMWNNLYMTFNVPATVFAARLMEGNERHEGIASSGRIESSVCYRRTETDGRSSPFVRSAELLEVSMVPRGDYWTKLKSIEPVFES